MECFIKRYGILIIVNCNLDKFNILEHSLNCDKSKMKASAHLTQKYHICRDLPKDLGVYKHSWCGTFLEWGVLHTINVPQPKPQSTNLYLKGNLTIVCWTLESHACLLNFSILQC